MVCGLPILGFPFRIIHRAKADPCFSFLPGGGSLVPVALHPVRKQHHDAADESKNGEEDEKAQHAVDDVRKIQHARVGDLLADLDRKGQNDDQRKDIDPGDREHMSPLRQKNEQGMDHKEKQHPHNADDQKVELLVREDRGKRIVDRHDPVVNERDQCNDMIQSLFHGRHLPIKATV